MGVFGPSTFVLANLRDGSEGREPDLPPESGFVEVAAVDLRSSWRLYEVFPPERVAGGWPGMEPVGEPLEDLLQRASRHSTALARVRERVLRHFQGAVPNLVTRETFCRILGIHLGEALDEPDGAFDLEIEPMGPDDVME